MIKNIVVPVYIKKGIKKLTRGCPDNVNIIAIDTETVNGEPYTIQIADRFDTEIYFVSGNNIFDTFYQQIRKRLLKETFNVIYGHNLEFDLPVIFYPYREKFIENEFNVKYHTFHAKVYTGNLYFAQLTIDEIPVMFLDSFRFVMTGLEKALHDLELPAQKFNAPEGLGEKKLISKEFIEYAKNDAQCEYILASWIVNRCKEYDIPIPVSVAQFAQYIFRKHFMDTKKIIPFPPDDAVNMALLSYHGGKNGCYINTPCLVKNINLYDINSAYPYAMANLPPLYGGKFKHVTEYKPGYIGIYEISGKYKPCKYGLLYDHKFEKIKSTYIKDVCITSYEIDAALSHGELDIETIEGYIYIPDTTQENPLRNYVKHFYTLKKTAKNITEKWIAKVCLNSLYGKFIQTTEELEDEYFIVSVKKESLEIIEKDYIAGGMFNPFLASLITAHTRCYCHDLEHRYNAIHTATDSIFTRETAETGDDLGNLKFEGNGTLLLLRNKLYIFFKDTFNTDNQDIKKHISKYALHGFYANLDTLIELWKSQTNTYEYQKMTKIKQSLIQINKNRKANMFNDYQSTLKIDWRNYYEY